MLKKLLCALFFVSVLAMPVTAAETDGKYIVVEADGEGTDRLSAINSAMVEALRQASGNFIDSKTELNNDELTERIISYSRGSVAKYETIMADDTQAEQGTYRVRLKVWVESDLLRDGVKVATNTTAQVPFSMTDLKPKKELDPATVENTDSLKTTNKANASSGVEALSAMLERYNPEDFISVKAVGRVTPVKGKEEEDLCQILLEVSFNNQLYTEAFIPDLKQVLDVISSKKKDITLTRQRDILRNIAAKKGAPMADNSVILSGAGLGKEFQVAVYDKQDRFGCRLYAFGKDDAAKILDNMNGVLAQFRAKIARVKGFEIELLDENGDLVSSEEQKFTLPFLLTDSVIASNVWAFHPTIMNYAGMYNFVPLYTENSQVTVPLRFELPEEFQQITKTVNAKLILDDDFADAWLKTRQGLHNTALNFLKSKDVARSIFEEAAESDYPLAQTALASIEANTILNTQGLLLEEVVDRLAPSASDGNYSAIYDTFLALEADTENFENQKKAVPYLTQAAMVHPEAMIRMGEVQEQGFYGVKPNAKKAEFYFKEGTRILSLLASQGLPSAAVALGHVYIEGLGTKQDTPRAERYYSFAEKSGYVDPEYWVWKHYGVTMRQVAVPEEAVNYIKTNTGGNIVPRTCIYLIREKLYSHRGHTMYIGGTYLVNVSSLVIARTLMNARDHGRVEYYTFSVNGDRIGDRKGFEFKK